MALRIMKSIFRIIIIGILVIFFSCEDEGWVTDCSDCKTTEPDKAVLIINLTEVNTPVTVNVYEGELEDSVLYSSSLPLNSVYNISAGLNKKYTVTAIYNIDGNTYTAVDSGIPRLKFTETQCEEACYFIYDNEFNLRIKYRAK